MGRVERYGPGEVPASTIPGDYILTHNRKPYGYLIRFGQRLRFRGARRPYAHWSHAALISDAHGGIIEALAAGVVRNTLEEYRHVEFHYVSSAMLPDDREQAVRFAESCLGDHYAWASIVALAFVLLTGVRFGIDIAGKFCSELVAQALERGTSIFPISPPRMMPADLAEYHKVTP
jgi:uncharacterized protein YycO